ncbi:MAG: ribonuclease D [Methyloligellaceae bacterium]
MHTITRTEDLVAACERLSQHNFITVDTEFMRESTFWPKLCLIQIASPQEELVIDPLHEDLDLQAFYSLMDNRDVVKVFHAARQDIEIVYHQSNIIPHPIFDTQVAAMVCGFGDSVSYSALVKKITKTNLDKTSRFTDWSRRPLSDQQLNYAIGDVTHLRDIYHELNRQLNDSGRASWLDEEMGILTSPETYQLLPELAWKRLKLRVKNSKNLAVLMEVAAWRETEAQKQDVPRRRIIKDEAIYDIANQIPRNKEDLAKLRTMSDGMANSNRGRDILDAVKAGLERDPKSLPPIKRTVPPSHDVGPIIDLLRVLLKAVSSHSGVATKLIANAEDLEKIAVDDEADVPALRGWRKQLFGNDALAIKRGELCLGINGGRIRLMRVTQKKPVSKPSLID